MAVYQSLSFYCSASLTGGIFKQSQKSLQLADLLHLQRLRHMRIDIESKSNAAVSEYLGSVMWLLLCPTRKCNHCRGRILWHPSRNRS